MIKILKDGNKEERLSQQLFRGTILEIFRYSKLLADCAWKVSKQFKVVSHSYPRTETRKIVSRHSTSGNN